jgi:hypothetical protein
MPALSIIIPVYNRGEMIRYTLASVDRASQGLDVETIVVDDGSAPPVEDTLSVLSWKPSVLIRQKNQGLLFARLAGLTKASGRYTLFLDSDDLVDAAKFRLQVEAMERSGADVSYTDTARCVLEGPVDDLRPTPDAPCPDESQSAPFFIGVQPAPHSPIFRTEYLQRIVDEAFFPPSPLYNPVAEIWFYHNAAPRPAKVIKVPGALTIVGQHAGGRLTDHWERLGVASLAVMEAFARSVPSVDGTAESRCLVGEKAFNSWRRLPKGISRELAERHLALWSRLSPERLDRLGGRVFSHIAGVLGPRWTGRLFKALQNPPYASMRTMSDSALADLLRALPPP